MTSTRYVPSYPLGNTQSEHERLGRQARMLAPVTERFIRGAGVASSQRVLDLGSGAGDVSMLVASIVGPGGEVVGVERNAESVEWAREHARTAGAHNVSFIQSDVSELPDEQPFDAMVGRFILMFLPDPVSVLRSAARLVKPGGTIVFVEPSWTAKFKLSEHAPLWAAGITIVYATMIGSGAEPDMGLQLYRVFQEAGLPAPDMQMETILGSEPERTRWLSDLIHSLQPQMQALGISIDALGDLETLTERVQAHIRESKTVVPIVSVVAASCKKTT
jgi:ubiquinone/menaquinone biosynthesis C-methylase UbiE